MCGHITHSRSWHSVDQHSKGSQRDYVRWSYANGHVADRLDRLEPADATSLVLAELERIRPATRGQLQPVKVVSWQRDVHAGGVYAAWAPGHITAFANGMSLPDGRLHFAGEHTARLQRGMEGAMESGERVALEVLEKL